MSSTNPPKEIGQIIDEVQSGIDDEDIKTSQRITATQAILKVIEGWIGNNSPEPPVGKYENAHERGIAAYGANQLRQELRERLQ